MTDKKLTDEEIINNLKFCEDCSANINIDIIDFINRQKSEIERLQKEVNLVSIQFQDLQERTNEVKAEAYKEFAEKLKEKSFKTIRNYGLTKDVVEVCDIDTLLKEMVGEEE